MVTPTVSGAQPHHSSEMEQFMRLNRTRNTIFEQNNKTVKARESPVILRKISLSPRTKAVSKAVW